MARMSRTPITQVVTQPVVQQPAVQTPVVVTPVTLPAVGDLAFAAALSAKPYPTWTTDEKRWMADHERVAAKANSGTMTFLGMSDDGKTFSVDIAIIDQSHPKAKKSADNRPYLFAIDSQQFTYNGAKYNLSAFYALKAK